MEASPARACKGLVVIGATISDAHVVSIYLLSMLLEEHGYEVLNLSCCNQTADFFNAIPSGRRAVAVVIANQNGCAVADLADLPELRRRHAVPVVVGGHYHVGCGPTDATDLLLHALGVDCIVHTPEALLAYLDKLPRAQASHGAGAAGTPDGPGPGVLVQA